MNKLMSSNEIEMTSREIAEYTAKEHKNVKRDILSMLNELVEDALKFERIYIDSQNRTQTEYSLDKDHTITLISGYSAAVRRSIIRRWQELENNQHKIPQTYGEALQLAANQAVEIETQNKIIELQAPAVEFVDNYTKAETGSKGFRAVAKLLKANERVFRKFLVDQGIMYKPKAGWTAYQKHTDAGRFEVTTGERNNHIYNETLFTGKGITWIAGEYAKFKIGESK